ncbi:MAG: HAD family hydrolase [Sphingobacteriia bacterium]|nr:HAD family hydrolase [Sphingobacteriia bacterium]
MSYKGIIFDLDGTLADSLADLALSMNWVLASYGYPVHEKDDYKRFVGSGIRSLIERALPVEAREGRIIDKVVSTMMEYYSIHCTDHTELYPGIEPLVKEAKDRGLKLAVFSNKPHPFTEIIVNRLLPGMMDMVQGYTCEELKKPNPAEVLRICRDLSLSVSDVLYVGDSDVDIITAKNAGMRSVGVLWGFRGESELRKAGADYIVSIPSQILELL